MSDSRQTKPTSQKGAVCKIKYKLLQIVVAEDAFDSTSLAKSGSRLAMLLQPPLPPDLQAEPIGIPSAFRRLDLTHFDVLALGQNFVTRFPDRFQAILLLGLRTAGSYFAPLLRAFLKAEAYRTVSSLTVQPNKGPGRWEGRELSRYAQRGYMVVILDDPPYTGGTIDLAFDIARRAGFAASKLKALIPTQQGAVGPSHFPTRLSCRWSLSNGINIGFWTQKWWKADWRSTSMGGTALAHV